MYGMPSRIRPLYHRLKNKEALTIDRDIELAISEFAPGSQKTKDKVIHTSIGFTAALVLRDKWRPVGEDPLASRTWIVRCLNCGFMDVNKHKQDVTQCNYCGEALGDRFVNYEVATPIAFRTDLSRGKDSKDEFGLTYGIPATLAEHSELGFELVEDLNCELNISADVPVWRVNDNAGKLFTGGEVTTTGYLEDGNFVGGHHLPHQWIEKDHIKMVSAEKLRDDQIETIALGVTKVTDVLRFRPAHVPFGLNLDPISIDGGIKASVKAAIYSAAFFFRKAAAGMLDIDPEEIEICGIQRTDANGSQVGTIALSDRLANGAGFVMSIKSNWRKTIETILSPPSDSFASFVVDSNRHNCDSACYDCLKVYRNMIYHGLLDWRLGLAYLRILRAPNYVCGLDGQFEMPEIKGWLDMAIGERDKFVDQFKYIPQTWGKLPGFESGGNNFIVVHPLWDTVSPRGILAEAIAEAGDPKNTFYIDTFNLFRRPGWCHMQLGKGGLP